MTLATSTTSRERMAAAMRRETPDRVPLMCQLSLGHYFLHAGDGLDAIDIWHDTPSFGEALLALQRRYGFDGILVNLPGRDPEWRRSLRRVERRGDDRHVVWSNGRVTIVPPDDNPYVVLADRTTRPRPTFEEIDPDRLYYVEPYDIAGVTYPQAWGFGEAAAPGAGFFPPWQYDTIRYVRESAPDVSVHGEVFSPFSQLMELLDYTNALMALLDDAGKVTACLDALAEGTVALMRGQARAGVDAVLVSSAFAGAGLISRAHYERFVLPVERRIIAAFRESCPGVPVYTHTCGSIGDRLDLLAATGTDGIDTLDPPPLGNVELAEARRRIGASLFIKGNVDPVNTLLLGSPASVYADALARLAVGMAGGGYILSTACSVSPGTPPENIEQLRLAVEAEGAYHDATA